LSKISEPSHPTLKGVRYDFGRMGFYGPSGNQFTKNDFFLLAGRTSGDGQGNNLDSHSLSSTLSDYEQPFDL
jgi:hypothetical protein